MLLYFYSKHLRSSVIVYSTLQVVLFVELLSRINDINFTDCKKILECSLELHDKYTKSNSDPCNDLQVHSLWIDIIFNSNYWIRTIFMVNEQLLKLLNTKIIIVLIMPRCCVDRKKHVQRNSSSFNSSSSHLKYRIYSCISRPRV